MANGFGMRHRLSFVVAPARRLNKNYGFACIGGGGCGVAGVGFTSAAAAAALAR